MQSRQKRHRFLVRKRNQLKVLSLLGTMPQNGEDPHIAHFYYEGEVHDEGHKGRVVHSPSLPIDVSGEGKNLPDLKESLKKEVDYLTFPFDGYVPA